jgi:uroporphyrinogen-III synthase
VVGTLADIQERAAQISPPAVTVVGEVVRLQGQLEWFEHQFEQYRPLLGLRVLNTRPVRFGDAVASNPGLGLEQEEQGLSELIGRAALRRFMTHAAQNSRLRDSSQPATIQSPNPLRQGCATVSLNMRLAELGAEPVCLPAIMIAPTHDPIVLQNAIHSLDYDHRSRRAAGNCYDWIVFTSLNAVNFFCQEIFSLGYDARLLNGIKLATFGSATAAALRAYGLVSDFIATQDSRQQADDLLSQSQEELYLEGRSLVVNPGERVLLPRSDRGRPTLAAQLEAQGAIVETITAYSIQSVDPDPVGLSLLLDGEIDLATFFSPSAVNGFSEMLEDHGGMKHVFRGVRVACIGPTTASAAQKVGLQVDFVPQEHTVDGLLNIMIQYYGGNLSTIISSPKIGERL